MQAEYAGHSSNIFYTAISNLESTRIHRPSEVRRSGDRPLLLADQVPLVVLSHQWAPSALRPLANLHHNQARVAPPAVYRWILRWCQIGVLSPNGRDETGPKSDVEAVGLVSNARVRAYVNELSPIRQYSEFTAESVAVDFLRWSFSGRYSGSTNRGSSPPRGHLRFGGRTERTSRTTVGFET